MTSLVAEVPSKGLAAGSVISYERISRFRVKDVDNTEVLRGVDRQAVDAIACALERGLPAPVHITDNNRSASRFATREREGWTDLLEQVKGGGVRVVLVWLLDRVIRQTRDLDDLLDVCRDAGAVIIQTASGTVVDPDNPDSVAMAKIAGVLAEVEVAKMSLRQRRKQAELAGKGRPHGGRRRFGYEDGMAGHREPEATEVRQAFERIAAGDSLAGIARDWNARGVSTVLGGQWTGANVGAMLKGAHHAGIRVHRGVEHEGTWEGLVDRETWEHVTAILSDPSRGTGVSTARRWLLTGVARCGQCGGVIRGRMAPGAGGVKAPAYICETTAHVHVPQERVDAIVLRYVAQWLEAQDPDGSVFSSAHEETAETNRRLSAERERLRRKVEEYGDMFDEDEIDREEYRRRTDKAKARIEEVDAALKNVPRAPRILAGLLGGEGILGVLEAMRVDNLDRLRAVVDAVPVEFVVTPAPHRGARFTDDRVQVRPVPTPGT